MRRIGLYGGTFDPIHNGHIKTSLAIQNSMHFDSYRFLPCKIPTLKAPAHATTNQRIAMLEIALQSYPQFELDLREINRVTPSYTVETLTSIREEQPNAAVSLILGYDAFISLPQWYQWEKILTLANVLVMSRNKKNLHTHLLDSSIMSQEMKLSEHNNNFVTNESFYQLVKSHQVHHQSIFLKQKSGAIYEYDAGFYPISSTQIRQELKEKKDSHGLAMTADTQETLIPREVYAYIKQQELYQ